MGTKRNTQLDSVTPIACTLTNSEAAEQALAWVDLQHRASAVTAIESGVRMTLPAAVLADVQDLARREADCCAFLAINTTVIGDELALDITSSNPDALPVIAALSGLTST